MTKVAHDPADGWTAIASETGWPNLESPLPIKEIRIDGAAMPMFGYPEPQNVTLPRPVKDVTFSQMESVSAHGRRELALPLNPASLKDAEAFFAALDNPPAPSKELRALFITTAMIDAGVDVYRTYQDQVSPAVESVVSEIYLAMHAAK
jgi:hypothetical protein